MSIVASESPTAADVTHRQFTHTIVAVAPLWMSLSKNWASDAANASTSAAGRRSSSASSASSSRAIGPRASSASRMHGTSVSAQCSAAALPPWPSNKPNTLKWHDDGGGDAEHPSAPSPSTRAGVHTTSGDANDLSSPFITFRLCATRTNGYPIASIARRGWDTTSLAFTIAPAAAARAAL